MEELYLPHEAIDRKLAGLTAPQMDDWLSSVSSGQSSYAPYCGGWSTPVSEEDSRRAWMHWYLNDKEANMDNRMERRRKHIDLRWKRRKMYALKFFVASAAIPLGIAVLAFAWKLAVLGVPS